MESVKLRMKKHDDGSVSFANMYNNNGCRFFLYKDEDNKGYIFREVYGADTYIGCKQNANGSIRWAYDKNLHFHTCDDAGRNSACEVLESNTNIYGIVLLYVLYKTTHFGYIPFINIFEEYSNNFCDISYSNWFPENPDCATYVSGYIYENPYTCESLKLIAHNNEDDTTTWSETEYSPVKNKPNTVISSEKPPKDEIPWLLIVGYAFIFMIVSSFLGIVKTIILTFLLLLFFFA